MGKKSQKKCSILLAQFVRKTIFGRLGRGIFLDISWKYCSNFRVAHKCMIWIIMKIIIENKLNFNDFFLFKRYG